MQKEIFTITQELFKLLTNHIQENNCGDNCCVQRLLDSLDLEKNNADFGHPHRMANQPNFTNLGDYRND